ncbi:hypothetical protein CHS0354_037125 [Potamilus streckersoni]|uniref:BHLH domain-containing protein n=1 Tax=Potamilus streckersoni TaxID=2493646 RepID=A0AAE0VHP1_9BIVA|nr:hypothetical protein CHS0354_037125 [Potamilus streckersoni]
MSLSVGGYAQGYAHPGPIMPREFYQYPQVRYPDYTNDRAYFHNWILGGTPEIPMSPESYGTGTPSPTDIHVLGHYNTYVDSFGNRCIKRRTSANKKERRRTESINHAFSQLRECIPNVPSDTKLSKIKTLRLAIGYISYLMDVLEKDDPKLSEKGFKADVSRKRERHEDRLKRHEAVDAEKDTSDEKKGKGRTGWPQHVWASELKNSKE